MQAAQALAFYQHPVVVVPFEEVAAIPRRGLIETSGNAGLGESDHVDACGLRIPADGLFRRQEIRFTGRGLRQRLREHVQVAAQFRAAVLGFVVGPEQRCEKIARDGHAVMRRQIGQRLDRFGRRAKRPRFTVDLDTDLTEEANGQHAPPFLAARHASLAARHASLAPRRASLASTSRNRRNALGRRGRYANRVNQLIS